MVNIKIGGDYMFNKGDKISHPMHGAGIIEDIEQKDLFGVSQQFYVIHIPLSKMKLMVAINKAEEMGLKPIENDKEIENALKVLEGDSTPMPENWTQRQKMNMEKK
jgi:CarD family transcriptional regulator